MTSHDDQEGSPRMNIDTPATSPTRASVMAAIMAGDRTEKQVANRHGIPFPTGIVWPWPRESEALWRVMNSLHCAAMLYMKVVGREWHYFPTARARREAKIQQSSPDSPLYGVTSGE